MAKTLNTKNAPKVDKKAEVKVEPKVEPKVELKFSTEEYLSSKYQDFLKLNDVQFQLTCKCGTYINVPFSKPVCPICKAKL